MMILILTFRWEGRPRSPPFKWDVQGVVVPPHDAWLKDLDLEREGIVSALIDVEAMEQSGIDIAEDLESTKDMLIKYAGK